MTGWVDEMLTNQSGKVTFQNEAFDFSLSELRNYFHLLILHFEKRSVFLGDISLHKMSFYSIAGHIYKYKHVNHFVHLKEGIIYSDFGTWSLEDIVSASPVIVCDLGTMGSIP